LGLAIVSTIVLDHQGVIKVFDNQPRGAKFVIHLPLAPNLTTQRRFTGVE
jgi:two-component system nitrogen regulation sensor histidine kinase NtrY